MAWSTVEDDMMEKIEARYPKLAELIAKVKAYPQMDMNGFLDSWEKIGHRAFSEDDGRYLLSQLWETLDGRYALLEDNMRFTDVWLSQERFNHILWELSQDEESGFFYFLDDMEYLSEAALTTIFCHRLSMMLEFLIQIKLYSHAERLLRTLPWIGLYEDDLDPGRNCILTYCIEHIQETRTLYTLIDAADPGVFGSLLMFRKTPAAAAAELGRRDVLVYLKEHNFVE